MPSRRICESTDQGGSYGRYGYGDQPRCGVPERHEYDDDQRGAHNYDDKYEYEYEGGCSRGGERERGNEARGWQLRAWVCASYGSVDVQKSPISPLVKSFMFCARRNLVDSPSSARFHTAMGLNRNLRGRFAILSVVWKSY